MERVQRNGGTSGIIAGVLLLLLFITILASRVRPEDLADPARGLAALGQKSGFFAAAGIIGGLASAFAVVFALGLAYRLRERAPTRALAQLYFAVIGLAGYTLDGLIRWLGGAYLVSRAATDQVAATHAYLALHGASIGLSGLGNAATGASLLVAGWAITSTGALRPTVGWVALVAGALGVLGVFIPNQPIVFFGSLILTIVWLLWAGNELRTGPMMR